MNLVKLSATALLCIVIAILPLSSASACSRAADFELEAQPVTGRSMDRLEDTRTNLWIFPVGRSVKEGLAIMT